jgi:hypothetical protein
MQFGKPSAQLARIHERIARGLALRTRGSRHRQKRQAAQQPTHTLAGKS